jgi:DMSO/TMAO reductase YedYZ molybdopterin-dependent catalytic subunit
MNKRTATLVALVAIVLILASAFTVYFSQVPDSGTLPSGEPPQWQIKLAGNVEQEKTLTIKDLTQILSQTSSHSELRKPTYIGVPSTTFAP